MSLKIRLGLLAILCVIASFWTVMKLYGYTDYSWWVISAPVWGPWALTTTTFFVAVIRFGLSKDNEASTKR